MGKTTRRRTNSLADPDSLDPSGGGHNENPDTPGPGRSLSRAPVGSRRSSNRLPADQVRVAIYDLGLSVVPTEVLSKAGEFAQLPKRLELTQAQFSLDSGSEDDDDTTVTNQKVEFETKIVVM